MARRVVHMLGKALRETGQALDRAGLKVATNEIYKETYSLHRPVMSLMDKIPSLSKDAFVAPSATVAGNVSVGKGTSVWYGAVVRGDVAAVSIGDVTNVQDRAVVGAGALIGSNVTIGHGALLDACRVGDNVLVGQGSIIQEGAYLSSNSIVAAGAVVLPGTIVPEGQLWAGNPAAYKRDITAEEKATFAKQAAHYSSLAREHASEF